MRDWTEIRKKGEKHYILFYKVLGWGLLTGILFQVIQHFVFGRPVTIESALIIAVVFAVCGFLFGKVMWNSNERAIGNRGE